MHAVTRLSLALVAGFALSPAMAAVQTYSFSSKITNLYTASGGSGPITYVISAVAPSGSLAMGETIIGTFSFDDAVKGTPVSFDPTFTSYGTLLSFQLKSASSDFNFATYDGSSILVGNSAAHTHSFSIGASNYPPYEFGFFSLSSTTLDYGSTAIPSFDRLTQYARSASQYSTVLSDGSQVHYDATITSFSQLAPVPEPETYAMLLAGLGVLGTVAARRRKQ